MDYINKFCPACSNNFTEDDDIVVCPECGTPHHRECYLKEGKCFNFKSHGKQDDLTSTYTKEGKYKIVPNKNNPFEVKLEPAQDGEPEQDIEKTAEESFDQFTKNILKTKNLDFNPSSTVLIEGRQAVFYEIAVKKNQSYYIPQFVTMSEAKRKIISYNIIAFFVPLAWSVYRKMYKFAAMFLALYMLIIGATGFFMFKDGTIEKAMTECMQEDPEFMENILLYTAGDDVVLTEKQQNFIKVTSEASVPGIFSTLSFAVPMILRFIYAINANKLYMKEIRKTIEKGEKSGLTGDKLKMFVYRKKGVVPLFICAIIGYFEASMFIF